MSAYQKLSALPASQPLDRVLEIEDPQGNITHYPLSGDMVQVGRGAEATLRLNHPSVSRKHAVFYCDKWGRWWVRDLGSSNGTKVNGYTTTERVLELADRIDLGAYALILSMPEQAMPDDSLHGTTEVVAVSPSQAAPSRMSALRERETGAPQIDADHLTRLIKLSGDLQNAERQSDRLRLVCDLLVSPEFCALAAVIIRVPKTGSDLAPQTICSPSTRSGSPPKALYIANGVLEALKQKPEPMISTDADDPAMAGLAALVCPLRNDEDSLFLLYVVVPKKYATQEWLTLSSFAADYLKQAENAWAARRMAKVSALVEIDLERARDIQMRLIPRDVQVRGLDVAIGFQPCRWVGGDYVDVLSLANGHTLLVVADVCGKGMPAALVSSSMHTMVHAAIGTGADMLTLTTTLNNHLADYLPPAKFVTAIFIEMDANTGQFTFLNAGHPAPIIVDPAGQRRQLDLGEYQPLGLRREQYVASADHLDPGCLLTMFTDGLTELRDQSGKMLTSVRLGDHFAQLHTTHADQPLQVVADQLNKVLDTYTGARLQSDDRTFLLARRP